MIEASNEVIPAEIMAFGDYCLDVRTSLRDTYGISPERALQIVGETLNPDRCHHYRGMLLEHMKTEPGLGEYPFSPRDEKELEGMLDYWAYRQSLDMVRIGRNRRRRGATLTLQIAMSISAGPNHLTDGDLTEKDINRMRLQWLRDSFTHMAAKDDETTRHIVDKALKAYAVGEMGAENSKMVEAHLARCDYCAHRIWNLETTLIKPENLRVA